MFDLSTFELQESIAKHNQQRFLESQRIDAENKKSMRESMIDNLNNQYQSLYENETSKLMQRKLVMEAAAIHCVKDAMFNIFESALMIDESAKAQYRENIYTIFDSMFNSHLTESGVKTLTQFKNLIAESNSILGEVLVRAEKYAAINEAVYTDIIETNYSSTSVDKMIVETFEFITEAETPLEAKVQKMVDSIKNLTETFRRQDVKARLTLGPKIYSLVTAAIRIILITGIVTTTMTLFDPIFTLIAVYFTAVNSVAKETRKELGDSDTINSEVEKLASYKQTILSIKADLDKILDKMDKTDSKYNTTKKRIDSAVQLSNEVDERIKNLKSQIRVRVPLKEAAFVEFLTEADNAAISGQTGKMSNVLVQLKSRIFDTLKDFDPYKGLEELKLANKVIGEPNYYQTYLSDYNSGSSTVYLIINALKTRQLTDNVEKAYVAEAKKYKQSLDVMVDKARKDGRLKDANAMAKQSKRLGAFLTQYELNKGQTKSSKLVKESVTASMFIDESVSLNFQMESMLEAAQYLLMYEASAEDINHIITLVQECNCDGGTVSESDKENMDVLVNTTKTQVTDPNLQDKVTQLESAVYQKKYMSIPDGISEAAGQQLKDGAYPKMDDFLTPDEKSLLDSVSSMMGKDSIVDIIKKKVVDVIQAEEKRTQQLEDEEEKLLNRLNKRGIQESTSIKTDLNVPKTLFSAIVMNRSKKYIQEATELQTGFDIMSQRDMIMSESLALYTMHETFNTLKFGKYDGSKINKLTNDYYYNKI